MKTMQRDRSEIIYDLYVQVDVSELLAALENAAQKVREFQQTANAITRARVQLVGKSETK